MLAAAALLLCQEVQEDSPGVQAGLSRWLEEQVKQAAARPLPRTKEEQEARKPEGRRELLRGLGLDPMPERTPLHARVTGALERTGYRVEKVAFESRPGFTVTANLYVPDGKGPFPVILHPHGHWQHKKSEPVVQSRAIASALHGYIAMVVDSPGGSFEGSTPIERREAGPHNDWRLILAGGCATGFYVWDLMRALDYLETRPEADMQHVGITGASGGGTATVYTFAVEERIDCAVPVVYATSLEVNPHNGCLCNHVPGTLRVGDRSDLMALRAPAPVLVIGATDDTEFPPEGTRRTGEKMAAIWGLYGAAASVRAQIFPGPHDYNRDMRCAALGFFDLHLRGIGDGSPVLEPEFATEPAEGTELRVLDGPPAGARSMAEIALERLRGASGSLEDTWTLNRGYGGASEAASPVLRFQGDGGAFLVSLGALAAVPGDWSRAAAERPRALLFLLSDGGRTAALAEWSAPALATAGYDCIALDLPGTGELAGLDLRLTAYLGIAPPALMADWLLAALSAVERERGRTGAAQAPVALLARGPAVSQAALLAALRSDRVGFVAGLSGLRSYEDAFAREVPALALQPCAVNGASLEQLRSRNPGPALWSFLGEPDPDWRPLLDARFP